MVFDSISRRISGKGETLMWREVERVCLPPDCNSRLERPMLEQTSDGNRPFGMRFVGLAASICQELEALPKLKSAKSLPV